MQVNKDVLKLYQNYLNQVGNQQTEAAALLTLAQINFDGAQNLKDINDKLEFKFGVEETEVKQ